MQEFLLIFRSAVAQPTQQFSPEQYQTIAQQWQDWVGSLAAQNKLVSTGKRLGEGKVVRADHSITEGSYAEVKEVLNGYLFLSAADTNEAAELAKGCPVLSVGGNVEVRPVIA
ncbi:YciI family protein [Taibaiella koreensis]|uniref:YciI family protein n=1 Tax=Taibaiella koreensis TaxID=1268548 RepID=UPI000E59A4C3|nr:YciI family protein [Taibaiella koreensis]